MKLKKLNPKIKWPLIFLPAFVVSIFLWTNFNQPDNLYKSINKNIRVFQKLYQSVLIHYVDEIDNDAFFQAGINGMLNDLDPYTVYVEKEQRSQLDLLTKGNYGGVGLLLQFREGVVTVGDPPFMGTPSSRAGLREGDKIIKVDGESSKEMGFNKTAAKIRGPVGSKVELTILRANEPKLLNFTLVREKIAVEDVRFAGLTTEGIGYILLVRFSKNAATEVEDAIRRLKAQGMKGLILDLRSNPGGVLGAAVEMSDLFIPKGKMIVSTRGRTAQSKRDEYARKNPVYGEGPLIVLVNGGSASASEIVAGAIQDHDRGIVVGDTTYGKGLVQSLIPLSDNAVLKMTTAKYYTPSGRCIQRIDYSSKKETSAEEKAKIYRTAGGREVHGGGGIAPDVLVELPFLQRMAVDLRRKSMYFNFAVDYMTSHKSTIETFTVSDKILKDFSQYLKDQKYDYKHPAESTLERLRKEAEEKKYGGDILADIEKLQKSLKNFDAELYDRNKPDIKRFLSLELSKKLLGIDSSTRIGLKKDKVYAKAVEIIINPEKYKDILK